MHFQLKIFHRYIVKEIAACRYALFSISKIKDSFLIVDTTWYNSEYSNRTTVIIRGYLTGVLQVIARGHLVLLIKIQIP